MSSFWVKRPDNRPDLRSVTVDVDCPDHPGTRYVYTYAAMDRQGLPIGALQHWVRLRHERTHEAERARRRKSRRRGRWAWA